MEILGVGPLEILFIVILALIILGPTDMVKAGRTIGRFLKKLVTSPTYHTVQETSRNLRTLPTRLMREAGLEEDVKDLEQIRKDMDAWRKPFSMVNNEIEQSIGEIQPPAGIPDNLAAWTTPPQAETRTASKEPQGNPDKPQSGSEEGSLLPQTDTLESQNLTDTPPEAS